MTLQRELLDKLAALDALEADKKEVTKNYNADIKHLRREVKRLRVELEAVRLSGDDRG